MHDKATMVIHKKCSKFCFRLLDVLLLVTMVTGQVLLVTGAGPRCYKCDKVRDPRDCDYIQTCADNQQCFSQKLIDSNLHTYYNLGCIAKDTCSQFAVVGKREEETAHAQNKRQGPDHNVALCSQCCVGDFCNIKSCGANTTLQYRRCMSCSDVLDPHDCDRVIECGRDSMCGAFQEIRGLTHTVSYSLRCAPRLMCTAIEHLYHQRCTTCCDDKDYCNMNICDNFTGPVHHDVTQQPTTTPLSHERITPTTVSHDRVIIGRYLQPVSAKCPGNGGIATRWAFNNNDVLPAGARAEVNGTLYIASLNKSTVGVYTCVTVSSNGSITKSRIIVKQVKRLYNEHRNVRSNSNEKQMAG